MIQRWLVANGGVRTRDKEFAFPLLNFGRLLREQLVKVCFPATCRNAPARLAILEC